jgi:glycosyltransferase involved in cell wall biosynthesis/capsular polysaccharide biosynthesis protein
MTPAPLSVLHVVVRAGPTNSQYNEHCLPVLAERRITVCSLFPADVKPPPALRMVEGDGTRYGCFRALRKALALGPYDVVHVHAPASGVLTLMTYLVTRRSRRNLVFTVHNSWPNFRLRNRLFLYWILARYPVVVTCGRSVRDSVPAVLRMLFGGRISVVQNGVDLERIDRVRRGLAPPNGHPTTGVEIVSVNRLIPLKDPYTVLEAFVHASGPDDRLVLVGDGPLREEIDRALETAHLTRRVELSGLVPRDEVYRMLSRADFLVSASRGEGLPVSVLEAMACGCPVVLSDIPPHREVATLAPGIPLVKTGDIRALADAMRTMSATDPETRRRLGDQGRRCVEEHFSVRSMNDAYGEIYRELAARNAPHPRHVQHQAVEPAVDGRPALFRSMRRRWKLVVGLVLLGALAGLGYATARPPEFQAKSSLVVGEVYGGSPTDDSVKASAALASSYADLARREPVLGPVATAHGLGDWRRLQPQVHTQPGDKNPLLIQIQVTAESSALASQLAEAIARRLVAMTANAPDTPATAFAQRELGRLEKSITQTESRIDALQGKLDARPDGAAATGLESDLRDLRARLVDLQTSYQAMLDRFGVAGAAGEIRIVEHAYATTSPLRPDPLALTAAGMAVGLAFAAGWVHLRTPHVPPAPAELPLFQGGDVRPMRTRAWAPTEPDHEHPHREGGRP